MNHLLLGLLAETFIHPGAGQTGGAIDLPVAREATTHYPFIAGSSFKGALRDAVSSNLESSEKIDLLFGQQDRAGTLLVSDARLLLLPMRSLSGTYRWGTCPHLLERLARDCRRADMSSLPEKPSVKAGEYRSVDTEGAEGPLYLEERCFKRAQANGVEAAIMGQWAEAISRLIPDEAARTRLNRQLVLLEDEDFAWFARNGLTVQARNVLDENKNSTNLWYEETLPPDTLMYAVLAGRGSSTGLGTIQSVFKDRPYLQVGGNETIGQGWFAITSVNGSET